jgi:Xaa-Pro aminopeptidase
VTDLTAHLEKRRERAAAAWSLTDEIVLVGAGEPLPIPGGADQTYPFIAHAEYLWLTDSECVGGVTAFDPQAGWVDFVPPVTEAERVWEGRTSAPGTPIQELPGWLQARRGRPVVNLGARLPGVATVPGGRTEELRDALMHARRPKDATELGRMRAAAAATAKGFEAARAMIRPGVSERAIQVELEAAFFRHGGDRTAYGTIVGAGSNSAVLHFSPSQRVVQDGDVVLIDAGAEVRRYASDITRTYRAGRPGGFFRELYEVVLGVETRGVARCVAGAEWRDIHLQAGREIAAGLVALGILRGDPDALVEQDAHALFFPHGLGHLVGLGVRDASGYLPGRKRSTRPGLSMLRTDLPLQPGYVITVEPGIYFIPALLNHPERRARYRDAVAWDRVDALLGFGGIRIEDNCHVTTGEPEVLTAAVPKTLD